MHHEKTSYLAGIYTSREEFMPRWNSCIEKITHRGNHASRVINYARREDFMPRQNLCIARRLYASLTIVYDEKISCLVKIYTSREEFMPRWNSCIAKIMHHGNHASRVINYARREDFMPLQNLYCKKILCLAGIYVLRDDV